MWAAAPRLQGSGSVISSSQRSRWGHGLGVCVCVCVCVHRRECGDGILRGTLLVSTSGDPSTTNRSLLTNSPIPCSLFASFQNAVLEHMPTTSAVGDSVTSESSSPYKVTRLPESQRKRILVTGGAGFVGSHLVDKLMMAGHEVTVVDNFFTGRKKNILHWVNHPNFQLINHDVVEPIMLEVDQIYHLACPASPPHYQYNPVKTIKTSTMGTLNMLGLAKRVEARILLTSTSEVYGDPEVHPQVRVCKS